MPDGTQIHYITDPLNRRIAREVNGTIVAKYLWADLTTLLAVYDGNDNLVQRFEYAGGRMPVAMTQGGQKYYLHYDQVGSLRAVSDANHNIVKEIIYDTYGNILTDTNRSFKIPFGFAGGLYDPDTKLMHFGYREYDSFTGKWTAKDPIGFAGGDSNLYGYVLGDPVNKNDPKGLEWHNSQTSGASTTETVCLNDGCAEEWRKAREICQREIDAGINPGITGGYTSVEQCARGLVSAACGGNPTL